MDNQTSLDGRGVAELDRHTAADDVAELDDLHVVDSAELRLGARYYSFTYKAETASAGASAG